MVGNPAVVLNIYIGGTVEVLSYLKIFESYDISIYSKPVRSQERHHAHFCVHAYTVRPQTLHS